MTKFKVGDIIVGNPSNGYSYTCEGSHNRVVEVGCGEDGDIRVEVISSPNGGERSRWRVNSSLFTLLSDYPKKQKEVPTPLTVKGHEPKLIIKVGCKEIPVKDAHKIASRMLTVVKVNEVIPCIKSSYDGEHVTKQDVLNFQKWLKINKIK